jgi:hypothetical protein
VRKVTASAEAGVDDPVEMRLTVPLSTRLLFSETIASVRRRAGRRLRVLLDLYQRLPDDQATRMVRGVLGVQPFRSL